MLGLLKRFDFLRNLFGGEAAPPDADSSARQAKDRLRKTLIMDQASVSSELIGVLKEAMIGVVSRYLEIDVPHLELAVERRNSAIALAANFPIVRVRKEGRALMPNPVSAQSESDSGSAVALLEKPESLLPENGRPEDSSSPETIEVKVERRNRRGRRHSR